MKGVVLLLCVGLLGWAGYDRLNDWMIQERLGSVVESAIDDPRTRSIDQIRTTIVTAARGEEIDLAPSAVDIVVAPAGRQPLAGELVSHAGVATTSQRMTVALTYDRRVWGRVEPHRLERAKVFISTATPPPGPQDTLLPQLP
jgi:hypothetical protein